jgi:hypothetical protein
MTMGHRYSRRAAALLAAAWLTSGLAEAQNLDVKVGQWLFTMTINGSPGDLSTLPPAARAQVEAMLGKPMVYPSCLTAKDLRDLNIGQTDEEGDCTVTTRKSTATGADFVRTCTGDRPRTETFHVEASSREEIRANGTTKGQAGNSGITLVGKWVGPSCKDDR